MMLINWTDKEQEELTKLAKDKDMSEVQVMRQALRLYQLHSRRQMEGLRPQWVNNNNEVLDERPCGCGGNN